MQRSTAVLLALSVSLAPLAACGEPPRPVDPHTAPRAEGLAGSRPAEGGAGHGASPQGASPHGGAPHGAAAEGAEGPLVFGGVARLHGALAEDREGFLFISLRPEAGGMPVLTAKLSLDDPALAVDDGGALRVPFLLDERHRMMAGMPSAGSFRVEVRYDPDGIVDTTEGIVVVRVPARRGATDHVVELKP